MAALLTLGIIDFHVTQLDESRKRIKEELEKRLNDIECLQILLPANTIHNSFGVSARTAIIQCAVEHPDVSFVIVEVRTKNEPTAPCAQKELSSAANQISISDAESYKEYSNLSIKELFLFSYGGDGFRYISHQSHILFQWIIDHADAVWCYAYTELLDMRESKWVVNLRRNSSVSFFADPHTQAKITEAASDLEPRRREVYQRAIAGEAISKIAQELGITRSETHYLLKAAKRKISKNIRIGKVTSLPTSGQLIYNAYSLKECYKRFAPAASVTNDNVSEAFSECHIPIETA